MHTYRKRYDNDFWEVFFDCGADNYAPKAMRMFTREIDAIAFVHYLNGGEVPNLLTLLQCGDEVPA